MKPNKSTLLFTLLYVFCLAPLLISCSDSDGSSGDALVIKASASATAPTTSMLFFDKVWNLAAPTNALAQIPRVGSPTELNLRIYSFSVSENQDCSDPTEIASTAGGQVVNFYEEPTLFSVNPADGTYPCIIIEMDDSFTFKADAEAAAEFAGCPEDTLLDKDTYREGEEDDGLWNDLSGDPVDATDGADRVFVFASTDMSAVQSGAIGAHPNQTIVLAESLVVPGTVTLYVDASDSIIGTDTTCSVEQTIFGFRE